MRPKSLLLNILIILLLTCTNLDAQVIITIAGNGTEANTGDGGPVLNAALYNPNDVYIDSRGNLYITCNNIVRKVDAGTGIITHIAGDGTWNQPGVFTGDGGPATNAGFGWARSVCADAAGNVYIADYAANNIRKVDAATGIISTYAGNSSNSYSGDGGPALNASMGGPMSICIDTKGNIFVANTHNNRIRRIDAITHIITTVAGNGTSTFSGDGGIATNAGVTSPLDLCVDAKDNIYIAELTSGTTCRVRKVNATNGIITTIAGNGSEGYSGDGGPATSASLSNPFGVVADRCGNVYIVNNGDSRVRKVDISSGIITTIAGKGIHSFTGDGGAAVNATLNHPIGISIDSSDNLYIADTYNNRIRKISNTQATISISTPSTAICQGSTTTFTASISNAGATPIYQWKKNGLNVGSNANTYTSTSVNNNDIVECELILTVNCGIRLKSNSITMHVTDVVNPTINITASPNTTCGINIIELTAVTIGAGPSPSFTWKKNGVVVGSNIPNYSGTFNIDDVIICELTSTSSCGMSTVASQPVNLQGRNDLVPEVTIQANETSICSGASVTFRATNKSNTANATFSWLVNGTDVGVNTTSFTSSTLTNGSKVECIMWVPECRGGSTKDYSDPIVITILPALNPSVTINASSTDICKGADVSFNANPSEAGNNPVYQWKVNGNNVGTNKSSFSSSTLSNGDVINCILTTSQQTCSAINTASSNNISIVVREPVTPNINIRESVNNFCPGTEVRFTANTSGAVGAYLWQLNGKDIGGNNAVFTSTSLKDGDIINCMLKPANANCQAVVSSNSIRINVKQANEIVFNPSSITINTGQQTKLNATVKGNIASMQWDPSNQLIDATSLSPTTLALAANTTFKLKIASPDGCNTENAITVTVLRPVNIPNSFTPNGDGFNDVFRMPSGVSFKLKELSIYDRWGHKVFTTTDITKGWDGKENGIACATNTYIYLIKGSTEKDQVVLKGTVMLIR